VQLLLLAGGTLLLYLGGEALVRSAVRLARNWGVNPMVVGLTVVALGTSSPELFASLMAALRDSPELALGNVVGSNTANIGLILGIAALITPIRTRARFLRREVPFMLAVGVALLVLVMGGGVSRTAGAVLVLSVGFYLAVLLRGHEAPEVEEEFTREYGKAKSGSQLIPWLGLLAGLLLLTGGARFLVTGATEIARSLGVAELTIGLSLVAVGTSLPELFTALVAALRKEPDIALGNVVGSNVLNVLVILGITALVRPITPAAAGGAVMDVAVMLGFSVLLLPFLLTGLRLGRIEASLLLLLYVAYVVYLFSR
jgi:cation:H+ antiporter